MSDWTPGPWEWYQSGGEWLLWGSHGMRPIVLDLGRCGLEKTKRLRVNEGSVMRPFRPDHPDTVLIASAPALAAEVERLKCELAETHQRYDANLADCSIENMEMEAEVERLRADAARYQWLRSRDLYTISTGGVFAGVTPQNLVLNGDDLDREIDAALARQEATGNG